MSKQFAAEQFAAEQFGYYFQEASGLGRLVAVVGCDLVKGNTTYVDVNYLANELNPTVFISLATMTATISTLSGTDISGALAMSYQTGSKGRYLCAVTHALALVAGQYYNVRIVATVDGLVFDVTLRVKAQAGNAVADEGCSC